MPFGNALAEAFTAAMLRQHSWEARQPSGQLGLGDTKPRDQVCKVPLPKSINRLVNLQLTGKVQLILIIKNS